MGPNEQWASVTDTRQTHQLVLTEPNGEGPVRAWGGALKKMGMEQVEVWQERGIFGTQISIHYK